jgi:hypothetical protein
LIERETSLPGISMSIEEYLEDVHRLFLLSFKQEEMEKGRIEALRLARSAGEALGREMARNQLGGRHLNDFEEFRTFWKSLMSAPLFSATQQVTVVEEGPKMLSMRVDRCLWAEHFLRIGDPELGYLLCCNADHSMVAAYNAKLSLHRTKTIMQGDDHCDHWFRWSEEGP